MILLRVESYKRGILISSALNVISKLFTFGYTVVIAYYFGTQVKTDIYFYVISTFTFLALFFTAIDSSVLIVKAMEYREKVSKEMAMKFLNFFLYFFSLICLVISFIIISFPIEIFSAFSRFELKLLSENRTVVLLSVPFFFLTVINTFLTDILFSYKFFTIPSIAGLINSIFILLFIILFHKSLDISSVLLGTIFANLLNLVLLCYLMKKQLGWSFKYEKTKIEKEVWKNIFFAQCGNLATTLATYFPLFLLSGFNAGVIAALNYGKRIADLPTTFITSQFSTVVNIKFNESYSKGNLEELNNSYIRTIKLLLFIITPLASISFIFSEEMISILYSRGAFDSKAISVTADFFKYFVIMLPFVCMDAISARLYATTQTIKYSFIYQIIGNVLRIVLIYGGLKQYGYIGYPLAMLSVSILSIFIFYIYTLKLFPFIEYKRVLRYLLGIILFNLAISIGVKFATSLFSNWYVILGIGITLYFFLLLLLNHIFLINSDIKNFILNLLLINKDGANKS
ncbi:lipid II flippase MurJ [Chitinophaga defluvii]|uniref:Lipid II flippase MurJ n=1 Tax=Chitinophaga defluvii TaxID=3163343 RepID=A0ABV2T6U8_9BACT